MQLVEQHVISKTDPRFAVIDTVAFAAKNLYNAALYEIRQAFIFEQHYLSNTEVYHRMKHTDA
jgi:putative transposase